MNVPLLRTFFCRHKSRHQLRLYSGLTPDEAGQKAQVVAMTEAAANSDSSSSPSISTLLAHAGIKNTHNAPMSPPLHLATTHTRPADGIYLSSDSKYGRMDNETRLLLEKTVNQLECVGLGNDSTDEPTASFAFSSGMMACTALILAHSAPIAVMVPDDIYHGVPTVLHNVFERHNVGVMQVDMSRESKILEAIERTGTDKDIIVWIEVPTNPKIKVFDIQGICQAVDSIRAERRNITTVVDVTMVSPVITRPLELGADVAMHSGTKYLAGHSDALLGVLSASPKTVRGLELAPILRSVQVDTGGVASAFDSWLTLRGLRTLAVRVDQQCKTAQRVAEFLDQHSLVSVVHYPGLESHPSHGIAKKQMNKGFGGVLSFEMEDEVIATALAGALTQIQRATSLGGTETLIEHRASIEPPGRVTSPPGLLRLSVGLEDEKDILNDLDRALSIAEKVVLMP